ncbi:MAG: hypothetical protein AMXMBFR6_12910 [Betaproteobacteria bacterium]|nr:hypothetical protein [Rhodocyclaceae bacterium]
MRHTAIELLALDDVRREGGQEYPVLDSPGACALAEHNAELCGSVANARSVVVGLRTGSPITMEVGVGVRVTFCLPSEGLGWEDVGYVIDLARSRLHALGLICPTPSQLQAALVGALEERNWRHRPGTPLLRYGTWPRTWGEVVLVSGCS